VTVVVLSVCPAGLRGHLTRWMLEISTGVYVGYLTARVRNLLWLRIVEMSGEGRVIMVYAARNEQRLAFKVHKHQWEPVDFDGVQLMLRPSGEEDAPASTPTRGWSAASKRRRFGAR